MIVITEIQDRLQRLRALVANKLTVTNAPEMYVQDVETLLVAYFSMRDSLARLTQKIQEKEKGEADAIQPIKLRIDQQMNLVLSQRYRPAVPPLIKPN